jgi:hypothetical protein
VDDGPEVTASPPTATPDAVAVLFTAPAASSPAVTVYGLSAEQVRVSPAASAGNGQVTAPANGSFTATPVRSRVPVFVTENVYWMVSPASASPSPLTSTGIAACLTRDNPPVPNLTTESAGEFSPVNVTLPGPFVYVPGVADVTGTVIVHDACPFARDPPVTEIEATPAAAVVVALHVPPIVAGLATTRPEGRLSVNDHPLFAASSLVFVMVNVSVETPPMGSVAGLNDLSSCGVTSRILMLSKAPSFPPPDPFAFVMRMPSVEPLNSTDPFDV